MKPISSIKWCSLIWSIKIWNAHNLSSAQAIQEFLWQFSFFLSLNNANANYEYDIYDKTKAPPKHHLYWRWFLLCVRQSITYSRLQTDCKRIDNPSVSITEAAFLSRLSIAFGRNMNTNDMLFKRRLMSVPLRFGSISKIA